MSEDTTLNSSSINEEDDDIITLQEAVQMEEALTESANAVLGGSDSKNCTYSQVCIRLL